jgi:asparagine synthase (glutamine-hydrolysing)
VCGIYGVIDPATLPEIPVFEEIDRILFHRGPDDGGLYHEKPAALGARRLAVIDLSAAGHQPMRSPDNRYVLVYNGEVYNFRELRAELEQQGHAFRSGTDTEVVLTALVAEGSAALERFTGMFTLALWDRAEKKLLLARDRFGIKPLYLFQDGARLAFASEVKALLALPGVDRTLDPEALGLYLTLGFVPGPRTFFARIRKAAPATAYEFAEGRLTAHSFWRLREGDEAHTHPVEELEARLKRVVERHLVADVPVGVFLSGGLDSSALVIAIRKLLGQPARTFTIGFSDPRYSEVSHARAIASVFGTDHRELLLEPDAVEVLPRIVWHLEEPLADTSILPLWFLCRMARERVTVALAGEGGDETFGGYTRYIWAPIAERYRLIPRFLRESIFPRLTEWLPEGERRGLLNVARRARKFVETGKLDEIPRYLAWFALFSEGERRQLLPSARGDALSVFADLFRASDARDPLRRLQFVDISTMLADNLLLKADKLSMAHSLELRVPYLDPEIAQFAYNLPLRWKVSHRQTKRLLRRWLSSQVPRAISRRAKQGFEVPIGSWFRGNLDEHAREILLGGSLRERHLLSEDVVLELLRRHRDAETDLGPQIFALLVLEHFFRAFQPGGLP